jgi:hypothetical protein
MVTTKVQYVKGSDFNLVFAADLEKKLTPFSKVVFEKLVASQSIAKSVTIWGIQSFIITLAIACR